MEIEDHAVGKNKVVPWDGLMERDLPEPSTALPGSLASRGRQHQQLLGEQGPPALAFIML